ncbi:hypothetical protein KJ657_02740 [Patescibacteria group bacterium]|nr:hypothetical protein [Patescibacteria group bacterium]MBU1015985.1 hypothetical protein [Patescibacteria group bacterium]MBU1684806.1 hypothetical protein [Patescibacteria group bacterium]MBU1938776.1 hypothetical protein [Patescibacteria group bacterium]
MAEVKKKSIVKAPAISAKKGPVPKSGQAEKFTRAVDQVFDKLKAHFDAKKVDAWQEKWLAVPANRKKYEKLADAPEVVGEELVAMTNDIIDFVQGEEGGKSNIFKKVKSGLGGFFKHPVQFLQDKAAKGKAMAEKAKATADKATKKAGKTAKK